MVRRTSAHLRENIQDMNKCGVGWKVTVTHCPEVTHLGRSWEVPELEYPHLRRLPSTIQASSESYPCSWEASQELSWKAELSSLDNHRSNHQGGSSKTTCRSHHVCLLQLIGPCRVASRGGRTLLSAIYFSTSSQMSLIVKTLLLSDISCQVARCLLWVPASVDWMESQAGQVEQMFLREQRGFRIWFVMGCNQMTESGSYLQRSDAFLFLEHIFVSFSTVRGKCNLVSCRTPESPMRHWLCIIKNQSTILDWHNKCSYPLLNRVLCVTISQTIAFFFLSPVELRGTCCVLSPFISVTVWIQWWVTCKTEVL
jgi:hypothetical protein